MRRKPDRCRRLLRGAHRPLREPDRPWRAHARRHQVPSAGGNPRAVTESHVEWNIPGKPCGGGFASRPIDKLTIVP